MEVLDNPGIPENKREQKKSRKAPEDTPNEFEIVHKKTKTENQYFHKLEVLAHG